MKVILSIKPEFCTAIFAGQKKYEYRRRIFKRDVDVVLIYATSPICKIVGEFSAKNVLMDTPSIIWENTKQYSGISKVFFDQYFHDINEAYALQISSLKQYEEPIDPKSIDAFFVAPQSYRYIN